MSYSNWKKSRNVIWREHVVRIARLVPPNRQYAHKGASKFRIMSIINITPPAVSQRLRLIGWLTPLCFTFWFNYYVIGVIMIIHSSLPTRSSKGWVKKVEIVHDFCNQLNIIRNINPSHKVLTNHKISNWIFIILQTKITIKTSNTNLHWSLKVVVNHWDII